MSTGCVVANVRPDLGRAPRDENPVGYGGPVSLHEVRHRPGFTRGLPRGNGEPKAQTAVRGKGHVQAVFTFEEANAASRCQTRKTGTDMQSIARLETGTSQRDPRNKTTAYRYANWIVPDHYSENSFPARFAHLVLVANHTAGLLYHGDGPADLKVPSPKTREHRSVSDAAVVILGLFARSRGDGGRRIW